MKYSDLATRLEEHDNQLKRNLTKQTQNSTRIRSLERQLETARETSRKLRDEHSILTDARETTKRELTARLG